MDTLAKNTHELAGPFEQWVNPLTGEGSAFVTFPVVDGLMAQTVYLTDRDEYGRWREWEISYTPALNREAVLYVRPGTPTIDKSPAPPILEEQLNVIAAEADRVTGRDLFVASLCFVLALLLAVGWWWVMR